MLELAVALGHVLVQPDLVSTPERPALDRAVVNVVQPRPLEAERAIVVEGRNDRHPFGLEHLPFLAESDAPFLVDGPPELFGDAVQRRVREGRLCIWPRAGAGHFTHVVIHVVLGAASGPRYGVAV